MALRFIWCLMAAAFLITGSLPGAAQVAPKRHAFVVGNSLYSGEAAAVDWRLNLVTPERDAQAWIDELDALEWDILNHNPDDGIIETTNLTKNGFNTALDRAVRAITPGSEVLFVFNGHGFSSEGANYLVPVPPDGEGFADAQDMVFQSIALKSVVDRLTEKNPARLVIIINTCSDRASVPFGSRAPAKQDFSQTDTELLVLYSSSPLGIAYDTLTTIDNTLGLLSVFNRELVPLLRQDRPLLDIFTEVRISVEQSTQSKAEDRRGLQIPHVLFDSINGSFTVANSARTALFGVDEQDEAAWKQDPLVCRLRETQLAQAVALRSDGANLDEQIRQCILYSTYGALGIEEVSEGAGGKGVAVTRTNPSGDLSASRLLGTQVDGKFQQDDVIDLVNFQDAEGKRTRLNPPTIDSFHDLLVEHFYKPDVRIGIRRQPTGGHKEWVNVVFQ